MGSVRNYARKPSLEDHSLHHCMFADLLRWLAKFSGNTRGSSNLSNLDEVMDQLWELSPSRYTKNDAIGALVVLVRNRHQISISSTQPLFTSSSTQMSVESLRKQLFRME